MNIGIPQLLTPGAWQTKHVSKQQMKVLDLACRVVLAALAAITSFSLFVPSLALGTAMGLYRGYDHDHSHCLDYHAAGGCSQSFMERMAGMHFSPEFALAANMAVTVCHIDHHPLVFVPYCSIALGMWAGQQMAALNAKGWARNAWAIV